ncbi:MAG: hypothetical protein E7428_11685 [Ruminococcaceae bacterium]|nr:hypothetical protein [Oscillospiraceae bacterium]
MKHTFRRMTALFLVLLMTSSLLASCSKGKEKVSEIADTYLGENVDLGLAENEKLMDIIETDGEIRATVGVTSDEMVAKYGTEYGTPYKTEYRYYDMEFVEDTAKREPTASFHQIAQHYDPSLNLTIGGEPYLYTDEKGVETSYGVRYQLYKDGEPIGDYINPRGANGYGRYTKYNARANLVMIEDAPFIWMDYTDFNLEVFIKDHFLRYEEINPDIMYGVYGIMEFGGTPYALFHGEQYDLNGSYTYFTDPVWEATRIIPLSDKTTELSLEGIDINGTPTGSAFGDGNYGYYMCGSELWRTDGKDGYRISDLIYCGVNTTSEVRTVRALSDGRILIAANGGLIQLTVSDSVIPAERKVYTVGVVNYVNGMDLSLPLSKFNSMSTGAQFVTKEYKDTTQMNLALLSGEVDMIITNDQFLLNNYIKQDLLAPLEEVAPELFEEGVLIENVVDATRVDGVCYYLPREFEIRGRLIECRVLEEGQTFDTVQEYLDFIHEKDPGYLRCVEKTILLEGFATNIDEWIDWETNTAHFDDGTFEAMLEFANEGITSEFYDATAIPYTGLLNLSNLVTEQYFTDIGAAKGYLAGLPNIDLENPPTSNPLSNWKEWAYVCTPLPTKNHTGYEIYAEHFFAVVNKEESRNAAGEFLKWHFLEDVVGEVAPDDPEADYPDWALKGIRKFSVNQAECERYIGRNLSWDGEDKEIRLPVEQRRYEDTWKIIRQANHLKYFRNAVFDVIAEEAYRYFAGEITVSQAAEYVQNRVSIYLAEQS